METVESGKFLDAIKKFADVFDKFMQHLEDGTREVYKILLESGVEILMEMTGRGDDGKFVDLKFKTKDGGNRFEEDSVPVEPDHVSINKVIDKYVQKMFSDDVVQSVEPVNSSMYIKLKKVESSRDVSVDLLSVRSDYTVAESLEAIQNIVNDDDFVDSMEADVPLSYQVVNFEDGFDVTPCESEDIDIKNSLDCILCSLWCSYLQFIHTKYTCKNDLMMKCDQYEWMCKNQIDYFSELYIRFCGELPHPINFIGETCIYDSDLDQLVNCMRSISDCYECYYCNFNHEDQASIDGFLRDWKHEYEYMLQKFS